MNPDIVLRPDFLEKLVTTIKTNRRIGSCSGKLLKMKFNNSETKVRGIKTEIIERHNRLKDDKDLLAAVTPWIVAGIIIVGLIAVSWITTEGYIKIANSNRGAAEDNRIAMESAQSTLTEVTSVLMAVSGTPSAKVPEPNDLGPQND